MSMARRLGLLLLWVALGTGCGDDDGAAPSGEDGGSHEPDEPHEVQKDAGGSGPGAPGDLVDSGAGGAPTDAGPSPMQNVDAGPALVDSGTEDPSKAPRGPSCHDDEMPCGDRCIPAIEPTLEDLELRIFSRSCALSASCHTGVSPKEGMDLTDADAIFSHVDQPSAQMPSAKLFDTDSPEDSYVLRKLRGMNIAAKSSTGGAATQMPPPPSTPLCEEQIQVIEEWVRAGATR